MGAPPSPTTAGGSVVAIGAGVPIASVIAAAVTSLSYQPSSSGDEVPVFGIAWGCAFLISILGMGSSLMLAHIQGKCTERIRFVATRDARRQAALRSRRLRRRFEPRLNSPLERTCSQGAMSGSSAPSLGRAGEVHAMPQSRTDTTTAGWTTPSSPYAEQRLERNVKPG